MKSTKKKLASDLACDYHIASYNSPWLLKNPSLRQANYSEHVQELVAEGPRSIETSSDTVSFERTNEALNMSLVEVLGKRKSSREFSTRPLEASRLGQLLGLANGVRALVGNGPDSSRNSPSAGNLGSCEMYVLSLNIGGVEKGLYHYDVSSHRLKPLKQGDFKEWVARMLLLQDELSEAGALIFLASNQSRLRSKYGHRAYRLGLLDAGHVSENIYLVATAMGLNVTATGGFIDDELNTALNLDGVDDCVVLVLAVGERP